MQKTYVYGANEIQQDASLPVETVKQIMSQIFPEVANAETSYRPDGKIEFVVNAGNKGADRTYVYGENEISQDADLPVETVKSIMARIFPEVANADVRYRPDGKVEFVVNAGNKGF